MVHFRAPCSRTAAGRGPPARSRLWSAIEKSRGARPAARPRESAARSPARRSLAPRRTTEGRRAPPGAASAPASPGACGGPRSWFPSVLCRSRLQGLEALLQIDRLQRLAPVFHHADQRRRLVEEEIPARRLLHDRSDRPAQILDAVDGRQVEDHPPRPARRNDVLEAELEGRGIALEGELDRLAGQGL